MTEKAEAPAPHLNEAQPVPYGAGIAVAGDTVWCRSGTVTIDMFRISSAQICFLTEQTSLSLSDEKEK